jgi:Cu(I)/Ag(I) efflux system membrane fusion protein
MKLLRLLLVILLLAAAFAAGLHYERLRSPSGGDAPVATTPAPRYRCPMHPDYVSDRPGSCPICGMNLVPIEDAGTTSRRGQGGTPAEEPPPGAIHISPDRQQLIGVTYGTVERTVESRSLRAVGSLAIDDTRVTRIHPRIEGWIERVFADETGQVIEAGQPLVTIYSPDVLAAQQEFLLALRTRDRASADATIQAQNEALAAAARKRLEVWDLSDDQIDSLAEAGAPDAAVTVFSTVSGFVLTRNAYPRQRVTAETELYTVADLSRLWVQAAVYEHDAPFIRPGLPARVRVSATGRTLDARVVLVGPQVDPATRTLQVRLDLPNSRLALRPDMFVDVEFEVREPERLTAPVSAVLDTGTRRTAFVDLGDGFHAPREVRTGQVIGDRVEILGGLAPGERIVVSGTFLIDSESQLKAATSGMPAPSAPAPAPAGARP